MSFKLTINPKDKAAARFISQAHKTIVEYILGEKETSNLTQQQIAERLGVNRSVVNRILNGKSNLTLRSIGELAWALESVPSIKLEKKPKHMPSNFFDDTPEHTVNHIWSRDPALESKPITQVNIAGYVYEDA